MPIAVGIARIVLGAIFKFAVSNGKIGGLDLHVVGVILILAGVAGMVLPMLIRNRSRFSRPITRSRQDVADERSRTVVEHTDGSQTLVEHDDGAQTFVEHFDAGTAHFDGQRTPDHRQPWAGSGHSEARRTLRPGPLNQIFLSGLSGLRGCRSPPPAPPRRERVSQRRADGEAAVQAGDAQQLSDPGGGGGQPDGDAARSCPALDADQHG